MKISENHPNNLSEKSGRDQTIMEGDTLNFHVEEVEQLKQQKASRGRKWLTEITQSSDREFHLGQNRRIASACE